MDALVRLGRAVWMLGKMSAPAVLAQAGQLGGVQSQRMPSERQGYGALLACGCEPVEGVNA